MPSVLAYGATSATDPLVPITIERREVGPKDVLIDIKFSGICHSDIHTARGEWGGSYYPIVTGHEIAGVVREVGSEVTKFKVGDHAGVGCMVDSCGECQSCLEGEENSCENGNTGTFGSIDAEGNGTQGGYSQSIVVTEGFVLSIPDSIPLENAAPLLCAGITTYSPLRTWGADSTKKVAVIGLGGLGHMAVKLAHAMGSKVTVLSQSLKKQEDGLRLGADEYYATSDPATFDVLKNTFDIIINTVSADLDLNQYLALLRPKGTLVSVGAPTNPYSISAFALIGGRKSFAGSNIGGIRETQEMLDFCAEHNVGAEIEVISADQINTAWDRVVASDVRYRFVIDTSTLTPAS